MWLIGVEVEQETSAPLPKKNPGSAPESCSLFNRWKAKNTLLLSLIFSLSPDIYIQILQTDLPTFLLKIRNCENL